MATKKPYTRHTNSADRRIDQGAQIPGIQPIVKPEHTKGAPVPGIQPMIKPPISDKPPASTQPSPDPQPPPTSNQPAPAKPKPSGTESTK